MITHEVKQGYLSIGKTGIVFNGVTNQGLSFGFHAYNLPDLKTIGISNITTDQKFVFFADYDKTPWDILKQQIRWLAEEYKISHLLIIQSSKNNFHLISFEKFTLSELETILDQSLCDHEYKTMPQKLDKGWILRATEKKDLDGNVVQDKPKFFGFLNFMDIIKPTRQLSRTHYEFFRRLYPNFEISNETLNKYTDSNVGKSVTILQYGTSKKDFLKMTDNEQLQSTKRLDIEIVNEDV